jgi:hypothetical protein
VKRRLMARVVGEFGGSALVASKVIRAQRRSLSGRRLGGVEFSGGHPGATFWREVVDSMVALTGIEPGFQLVF